MNSTTSPFSPLRLLTGTVRSRAASVGKCMTPDDVRTLADDELPKPTPVVRSQTVATTPWRTIERLGKCHAADVPQFRVRVGDDIFTADDEPTAIYKAVAEVSKLGPVTITFHPPLTS